MDENKPAQASRRDFFNKLGVAVGGAGLVGAGAVVGPPLLRAAEPAKGNAPAAQR